MTSERPLNDGVNTNKSTGVHMATKKKSGKLGFGDMIWVKLRGSSWWPAQVIDAESLGRRRKPRKRSEVEVLVRLYGSYELKYVDPKTCRSEFEKVLQKNNGDCTAIFESTLQKDLAALRSRKANASEQKSNGEEQTEGEENETEVGTTANMKSPQSERKVKVMQNLGLVAPEGSPYRRKGPRV